MNKTQPVVRKIGLVWLLLSFASAVMVQPAFAAVLSTQDLIALEQQTSSVNALEQTLAREDVRAQLLDMGVNPDEVQARIAALSPAELASLNQHIADLPAGSGAVGILGAVFLVLLVLELLGVTDVFKAI